MYPAAQIRTRGPQCLPRDSILGVCAQESSRILPRGPCHFESGRGFGRVAPSTLALAAWWRWYLYFYRIGESRGEQIYHTSRAKELSRLVESGKSHRDYSLATPSVGHETTAGRAVVCRVKCIPGTGTYGSLTEFLYDIYTRTRNVRNFCAPVVQYPGYGYALVKIPRCGCGYGCNSRVPTRNLCE